jgi:hypothetical protein
MAEYESPGDAGHEPSSIEPRKIIYVLIGCIVVLLCINGLQLRAWLMAQDTIDILTERVPDPSPSTPQRLKSTN